MAKPTAVETSDFVNIEEIEVVGQRLENLEEKIILKRKSNILKY